jgi:hypothetical protein
MFHQQHHNTHRHIHVSDHDVRFQHQSCDVEETDLETKW